MKTTLLRILGIASLLLAGAAGPGPLRACGALRGATELQYWDLTRSYNGYTLFAAKGKTYLVDMLGCVVHTWNLGTNPHLLDDGHILDAASDDPSGFSGFKELDWNGSTVWSYLETRSTYVPHHDFTRIYNPKLQAWTTLYLANRTITHTQAIAAGCDPANGPYDGAQADAIVEVDTSGNVVWEWCFFDHGIQDVDAAKSNYVGSGKTLADYPGRIDLNLPGRPLRANWLDCNSLDYNDTLDQIVVCATRGEFYVIDHGGTFVAGDPSASIAAAASAAGDFLYRFGDPARYGQGTAPSVSLNWDNASSGQKQIGGAHHVQWIRTGLTGAGHFLVVDNGQYLMVRTAQSAIVEINPFLNSSGTSTGQYVNPPLAGYNTVSYAKDTHKASRQISKQVVWSYASLSNQGFFSHDGSSCQRLSNGNTLICATTEGLLFEVTSAGTVVWEYLCPVTARGVQTVLSDNYPLTNAVPRAYRYAATHAALAGHDLTPKGTLTALSTVAYFPWLGYVPGETNVGLGFANPDDEPAWTDLNAYTVAGETAGTACLLELPVQGQDAGQAEGLLGLTGETCGWVKAVRSASGVRGFFLAQAYQNGELVGLDGAPALDAATTDGIVARVRTTGGYTTELALANPGESAVTVTLAGADGSATRDFGTYPVPAHGGLHLDVAPPFDGDLRVTATGGIVGTALVRYGSDSLSVLNLTPTAKAASRLYAPHITRFGSLYDTEVSLVNPGTADAVVTLSPFGADGTALADPVSVVVPAGQVRSFSGDSIGLGGTADADGWLRVDTSAGTPLVGCVTFGNPVDHRYESCLPLQAAGACEVGFAQVANGTVGGVDYFTGAAVVNPSAASVTVTLQVRFSDGSANGNAVTRTLAAGEKYVRLLSQMEGVGTLAGQASGSLEISASGPVLAFALFGDTAGKFLSAVPAQ